MPFTILQQDITKMKVDAIVNAANTDLQMGGGVCGAIFKVAGATQLQTACDKLSPIKTGEAVITPGFNLPAKFVIHTAGPIYQQENKQQNEQHLRDAYTNSLKTAVENNCESIAFPLISSGIYGYPKDEALQVATSAILDFLVDHDLDVTLVVFDKSMFIISHELIRAVESYIDEHYIDTFSIRQRQLLDEEGGALYESNESISKYKEPIFEEIISPSIDASATLDDSVGNPDEQFSHTLLHLINVKKMTDIEVYKRANLDRKLFSEIKNNKEYVPSKHTVIALAVALELSLDETNDFLDRAGYSLSHTAKFDVIVEYFIINGKYNVFEINEVMFEYDQPLLGV